MLQFRECGGGARSWHARCKTAAQERRMGNLSTGPISLRDLPRPFGTPLRPQRSLGLRATTDFPVVIHDGYSASHCRAVEVSSTGIVLERRRQGRASDSYGAVRVELFLPGVPRPV